MYMNKVYVESVLALIESQVGYCEKKTNEYLDDFTVNAGSGNFTKYARDLDAIKYWNKGDGKSNKNGFEWCAPFCNWIIWMCSGKDVDKTKEVLCIPKNEENLAAGCEFLRKYFRAAGRYDAKPKIGDLILFTTVNDGSNSADHVGFISDIGADGKLYTIEGNKDNKVTCCAYPYDYWKVLGFCHPRYDVAGDTTELSNQIQSLQKTVSTLQSEKQAAIDSKEQLKARIKAIIEE